MDNRCHLPRRHPRHSTSSCHGISAYVADESPSKKKRSIDHATFLKKKRRKEYQIHRGIKKDRVSRSILRATALSSWERILSCITIEIMRGKMPGVPWSSISRQDIIVDRCTVLLQHRASISSIIRNIHPLSPRGLFWLLDSNRFPIAESLFQNILR